MKIKKIFGFTVSEVMIAMAVIGIVTIITIPAVVSKYQKQAMLTLLKKNYVELQENMLVLSTEAYNKNFYKSSLSLQGSETIDETAGEFLSKYYTIIKSCGTTAQPCFAAQYRSISGTAKNFSCADGYSVIVKGGAAICLIPADTAKEADDDEGIEAKDAQPARIYLDINGTEKPNIGGRDMFSLFIYDYQTIDDGAEGNYLTEEASNDKGKTLNELRAELAKKCISSSVGEGCLGKILNDDWKMNY